MTRERGDFMTGKVDLVRERDELTKEKGDFVQEMEALIGERAELAAGKKCVAHHKVDPDAGGIVPGYGHHQAGRITRVQPIRPCKTQSPCLFLLVIGARKDCLL
jgi:hypothetical protein